jgi:CheY-like chemotaxis protein
MDARRKILIADDAAMFRELGALFLARSGRVITANNGIESLDAMRRHRPHVVVADLDMPDMDGEELCRCIKADPELRDTPVILVTRGELADERARAVRAGADDVIDKPISRIALIQAVNRFLRGPTLRGLARVSIETEVHIVYEREERWGTARNLSRGGIFIEAEHPMPPASCRTPPSS